MISISIVVFKPDLLKLKKTCDHLHAAVNQLSLSQPAVLYLINNSHSNASEKEIKTTIPPQNYSHLHIQYIAAPKNLGYGKANNIAIHQTTAAYHLVLNPDAYLAPDCLKIALEYLENNIRCVLLSPAVFYENGKQQYLCRKNITLFSQFLRAFAPKWLKNIFSNYLLKIEYRDHDYHQPIHNVPFLTGCFMLLRTEAAKAAGGFDPRYFLYIEDADLTRILLKTGNTVYYPKAKMTHSWARMSYKNFKCRWYHVKSTLQYCWKFRNASP